MRETSIFNQFEPQSNYSTTYSLLQRQLSAIAAAQREVRVSRGQLRPSSIHLWKQKSSGHMLFFFFTQLAI